MENELKQPKDEPRELLFRQVAESAASSQLLKERVKKKLRFSNFLRKLRSPNIYAFANMRLLEIEQLAKTEGLSFRVDPSKFVIGDPGKGTEPSECYQKQVSAMFGHLAEFRKEQWHTVDSTDISVAQEHARTELDSLRSEMVDLKSQIASSERVTAVWMVGSIFAYSKDIIALYPILFVPLLLAVFGFVRFKEFQRNVFDLDCYLREIELVVRPDAGWVTYFFRTRIMERFFDTRQYFWVAAIVIATSIPIMGWTEYLTPQEIRVTTETVPSDPILERLHSFFGYSTDDSEVVERGCDVQTTPLPESQD